MKKIVENLAIKTKIILVAAFLLIVTAIVAGISISNQINTSKANLKKMETEIRKGYDDNMRNQVELVISMLNKIEAKRIVGEYTKTEAKDLAMEMVRDMRYGDNGYFWIDTYDGKNIVLLGSVTEGSNNYNAKDMKGFHYMKALIKAGQKKNGGFVNYCYPKPGEKKAMRKRGYALAFDSYNWIIGTGNYTNYIDKEIHALRAREDAKLAANIFFFVVIFMIACIFAVFVSAYLAHKLNEDFALIRKYFKTLSKGDFTAQLPASYTKRKDDFGILARDLEMMKNSVAQLVGSAKSEADHIIDIVNSVNENVQDLNNNIEDVAATTQELAAGMEETSASAQEMSATSQEIETASRTIAQKSQEAALQVVEISKRAKDTKENVQLSQDKAYTIGKEIEQKLQKALEQVQVVAQIDELSNSIMGITAQTNLLALNAAIEAARAGESGKGFSVVADEIRRLADQSKAEVEKIQEITGGVTEAVSNLSDSAASLLQYVSTDVTESFQKFMDVADAYHNDAVYVDGIVGDFSATSEELLASIQNIMAAVDGVAKAASEGAAGTGDIAGKVSDITNKSAEVANQVEASRNSSEILKKEISNFTI